jgi:hypothetical protein
VLRLRDVGVDGVQYLAEHPDLTVSLGQSYFVSGAMNGLCIYIRVFVSAERGEIEPRGVSQFARSLA